MSLSNSVQNFEKNGSEDINFSKLALNAQKALDEWTPFDKNQLTDSGSIQVIDFFSGCGGMSAGFAAISSFLKSFEFLGACDIDEDALATYARNFGCPVVNADVAKMSLDDEYLERFLDQIRPIDPEKPLILIGCAPCQGFTSHRKKNWSEEDERNSLVGAFANLAVKLDPDCIIMENVPEMLSGKYWDYFETARDIYEQSGYQVKQKIYNSASFGVPQERFRALVMAMKNNFNMPNPLISSEEYLTVKDAIGDLPEVEPGKTPPNDPMHRSAAHRKSTIETIKAVPKDGGSRPKGIGPKCLDEVNGYADVYGRLYWNKPSITITHYARNPASGRFVHPEQNRGLTMREAARLQSFPDGFEFEGSFDSIFKQIGEAVPPKFSCAIAASVFEQLTSEKVELMIDEDLVDTPVSNSFSSVIAGIKSSRSHQ